MSADHVGKYFQLDTSTVQAGETGTLDRSLWRAANYHSPADHTIATLQREEVKGRNPRVHRVNHSGSTIGSFTSDSYKEQTLIPEPFDLRALSRSGYARNRSRRPGPSGHITVDLHRYKRWRGHSSTPDCLASSFKLLLGHLNAWAGNPLSWSRRGPKLSSNSPKSHAYQGASRKRNGWSPTAMVT